MQISELAQLLSIFSFIVTFGFFVPFELRWFYTLWRLKKRNPFISKRRPKMLFLQLVTLIAWTISIFSLFMMDAYQDQLIDPIWNVIIFSQCVVEAVLWAIFIGISMLRLWYLFWS